MNAKEVLARLESLGSEQTRKTYGRHGVTGDMFGVKYGDLGKLCKQIKVDHDLALALWQSGNHDARVLATMVADPQKLTVKDLQSWIKSVDNHVLSYAVACIAAKSPAGRKVMGKWMAAKGEWPAATGWMVVAAVAADPDALTAPECRKLLATIEKNIHSSKNRVKYSMNTAMIAMGSYVPGLMQEAINVADRVGQVEVDHGLTNCQTPLAAPYIRKAVAHQKARRAKAGKKAGKKKPAGKGAAAKGKATGKSAAGKSVRKAAGNTAAREAVRKAVRKPARRKSGRRTA